MGGDALSGRQRNPGDPAKGSFPNSQTIVGDLNIWMFKVYIMNMKSLHMKQFLSSVSIIFTLNAFVSFSH